LNNGIRFGKKHVYEFSIIEPTFPHFAEFPGAESVCELYLCAVDFEVFKRNEFWSTRTDRHQLVTQLVSLA